jgi:predicted HTH transcriptional regulator
VQLAVTNWVASAEVGFRPPSTTYALPKTQPNRSSRERWTTALDIATKEGRVTRAQLAGALGVSERTALRVLGELVNAGKLQADGGRGRAAGYLLVQA